MIKIQQKKNFSSINEFHIFQDKQLGIGSFGVVNLAMHIKTCKLYAIKIINLKKLSTNAQVKMLQKQNKIHALLDHPHIVKLWDNIIDEGKLYMIMEYVQKGSLFSHQNNCTKFSQIQAFKYFYQTLKALKYIHNLNIIHRDIKPQNLLLDEDLNIKVCDFGWATKCFLNKRNTFCGTYQYMAPEIIFERQYDHRVDIWSLGILLYELLHGHAPFRGQNAKQIQRKMKKGKYSLDQNISQQCKKIIISILRFDASQRIKIEQIQKSSWTLKMQKYLKIYCIHNIYCNMPGIPNFTFNNSKSSKSIKSPQQRKESQVNLLFKKKHQNIANQRHNTYTGTQNSEGTNYIQNLINFQSSLHLQSDQREHQHSMKLRQSNQKIKSYGKLHTSATLNSMNNIAPYKQKMEIPRIVENDQISDIQGLQTPERQNQFFNYKQKFVATTHNKNLKLSMQKLDHNNKKKVVQQHHLQYNLRETQNSIFIEPIANYISIYQLPTKRAYFKSKTIDLKSPKKVNMDLSQKIMQYSTNRQKTNINNSEKKDIQFSSSKKKKQIQRHFTPNRGKKLSQDNISRTWGKQFNYYAANLRKSNQNSNSIPSNLQAQSVQNLQNIHKKSKSKSKSKQKQAQNFERQSKQKEKQRERERQKQKQKDKIKRRQKTKDKQREKEKQKSKSKSNIKQKQKSKSKDRSKPKQYTKNKMAKRNTNPQLIKNTGQPTLQPNIKKK